jgi:hypothetical protein
MCIAGAGAARCACGAGGAVDIVFLLVCVGDSVSSDPAGDLGSGVSGLAALDSPSASCSESSKRDKSISPSVRSISGGDAVLSVC